MSIQNLLANNRQWAAQTTSQQPNLLASLATGQSPQYLWLGCADSRVPPNQILGLGPGEVFVHRNVANLVKPDDANAQAVVEYAVAVLQVKHIMVCGHYGCGGIQASMDAQPTGMDNLDQWLVQAKQNYRGQQTALQGLPNEQAKFDRMCELNVGQQLDNLAAMPIVKNAWHQQQTLHLHGLIYDLATGLLKDLAISRSG